MKKHLLPFVFLLFLITQTKAQTSVYHPFPDSNAYWNESGGDANYNDPCAPGATYSLFINGDTIIGDKIWHKLFESGNSWQNLPCNGIGYFNNTYSGSIREDTLQKKVFVVQTDSTELLLYDFSLSLGDTLPATVLNSQSNSYYVSQIDSILMGGNYRKRFWISTLPLPSEYINEVAIIEGMGSTVGLIASYIPPIENAFTSFNNLNCFSQNNQTLWPDSSSSCDFMTSINVFLQENFVSIYPNPATNQLTIHPVGWSSNGVNTSSFHNEAVTVSIMNVLGQPFDCAQGAAAAEAELSRSLTIDVSGLAAGIYFVEVVGENGRWMGKFVKE